MTTDVFEALDQEYEAIDKMLSGLDEAAWRSDSLCSGWSVSDVVLHLAQSEEAVLSSTGAAPSFTPSPQATTMDDLVEEWVTSERGLPPDKILARWQDASRAALKALREADPSELFAWATNPLKPRTLATTRLSEHWIHANDIAQPLGVAYPDTDRMWHIARLAHRTIPYAYGRAGRDDPPTVRVELTSPSAETWEFGDADAECVIKGSASDFCRIAARRLDPRDAPSISATGGRADEVLGLVRTYA